MTTLRIGTHWNSMASVWREIGPPLRPAPGDVALFRRAVAAWVGGSARPPRVLLLGVTPELHGLPWPGGTDLRAVDHSREMIEHVWPGRDDAVICSSWLDMELAEGSRDLVLCDGGLHLLTYPEGQMDLLVKLRRTLAPGGCCVFRLFVPPSPPETLAAVLDELRVGKIRNMNMLKLRMAMAMQQDPAMGVALAEVWQALAAFEPDFLRLAAAWGCAIEHVQAINVYRGSPSRYHFVTLDQARHLFADCGFACREVWTADEEWGRQCPVVVMEREAVDGRS